MTIRLKRFDTTLPLPQYQSGAAAGFDLYARLDITIGPQQIAYVPLNIALQLPTTHWALLAARSSLHKRGLQLINGIGVGDADYCGDNDEYKAALYNFTSQAVEIKKGERLVQMIILQRDLVALEEVTTLDLPDRGGFGSTGIDSSH